MSDQSQTTKTAVETKPKTPRGVSGGRIVRGLAAGLGFLYAGLCGFLWFDQEHFIFFPSNVDAMTPASFRLPFDDVWIPLSPASQEKLHGWWIPNPATKRVLLYLHGNGGNIGTNLEHAVRMRNFGASVLIVDYRGYGRSTNRFPSESRVYEDAEAAWQYLVREKAIKPQEIVVYGHSLGAAIAIELVSRHPEAAGLISESSFTSIVDMAKNEQAYSYFPVRWLVRQKFASLSKIPSIKIPILFIHGTGDEVALFKMSEQLYAAASGEKKLLLIDGAGHEDCAIHGAEKYKNAVQSFLISLR